MSLIKLVRAGALQCSIALVLCSFFFTSSVQAATLPELLTKLTELQSLLEQYQAQQNGAPQVLGATTIVVTNNAELATALSTVQGGETIQLAPGNYGSILIIGGVYSQMAISGVKTGTKSPVLTAPVKITSQDPNNRAVIDRIETRETNNWIFDSLVIKPVVPSALTTYAVMIGGNNNIMQNCYVTYSFENSDSWDATKWAATVGSGISVNDGSNNVIQNNYVSNVYMGISVGAPNTKVLSNVVNYFSGDGMRGVADNGLFEGNIIKNIRIINGNHPDGFQSWSLSPTGTPGGGVVTGTIVRGNVFLMSENLYHPLATGMQGIGMFDGNYKDWVIEDNVIMTEAYHGIAVYGAINVKVDHNTVINIRKNPTYKTWIIVAAHKGATSSAGVNAVTNNLASALTLAAGATIYNATNSVSVTSATSFPENNFVIPVLSAEAVYADLGTFNARLKSPSTYNNAGSRIFIDPRATTAPTIQTTPVTPPVVTTPAPTLTLSSLPTTVVAGGTATLTWSSTNATACTASGDWSGSKNTSGSAATGVLTAGTKTFTLTCTGLGGTITKSVIVAVTEVVVTTPAPVATLTTSATSVVAGAAATLTWSSTNATACTASGVWSGSKSMSGSESTGALTTTGTKTYTLTCTGLGGTITKSVTVTVTATPVVNPAPALTFTGSPTTVTVGSSISLTWSSTNATACTASGVWSGSKAINGSESTGSQSTIGSKTYTLSCTGLGGTVVKNVTINVTATATTPTTTLAGSRVVTNSNVNVRSTPNGVRIDLQHSGATGVIGSQAPVVIAGYTWVYVNFDSGADGYVAKNYLTINTQSVADVQAQINSLLQQLAVLQQLLAVLIAQQGQ